MTATLKVETAPGVEATTFTEVPESPLPETSSFVRRRFTVSKDSECVSFRFTQVNESAAMEITALEYDVRGYIPDAEGV